MGDIPATGRSMTLQLCDVMEFKDGKVQSQTHLLRHRIHDGPARAPRRAEGIHAAVSPNTQTRRLPPPGERRQTAPTRRARGTPRRLARVAPLGGKLRRLGYGLVMRPSTLGLTGELAAT